MRKQQPPQQKQKQQKDRYLKFEVFADMQNANYTYQESYGDITAPLAIRSTELNEMVRQPNSKMWIHNQNFKKLLGGNYELLPHPEIERISKKIIDTDLSKEKIKLIKTHETSQGDTKYWKYLGDEVYNVDGEGDKIKVGFVIRNGIGTGVALGIDAFTYRLICENGAVAQGRNIGSMSIRHIGQSNKLLSEFSNGIKAIMISVKEILKYYRKATLIKVGNELANQMYQRLYDLGDTYLPDSWNIKTPEEIERLKKEGKFKNNLNLIKVKREISLWETFNQITKNQRDRLDSRKIGFTTVAYQQNKLHQSLFTIVKQRGGV